IVPAASENAAIANLGGAKAAILMPDVLERAVETGGPPSQKFPRGSTRAVVGNDDLEVAVGLVIEPAQHGTKRIHAVIGRNDDGDLRGHHCPARPAAGAHA